MKTRSMKRSLLGSGSEQSNSGGFGLGYRWLQPLDEQIQYYPQLVKDASASLRNRNWANPTISGQPMTKASGWPEAFEFCPVIMASHWPPVKPSYSSQ